MARSFRVPAPAGSPVKVPQPATPPSTGAPTRRALLGGAAAAAASVPALAVSAVNPDASLIALCSAYADLDRRFCTMPETDDADADWATAQPLISEMDGLLARMDRLQARTPAGIQARAALLYEVNGFDGAPTDRGATFDHPDDSSAGMMLAQLLRDAAALAGLPGTFGPISDVSEARA